LLSVDIGDITPKNEGRFVAARYALQMARAARRKLNGIWPSLCQEGDYTRHVFDAWEETRFVEEAMINSDIEAVTIHPKEAIKPVSDGHLILLLKGAAILTSKLWK
jgi:hypothetical protein